MMKKVGCLTFHYPYNHCSSLRAYALQEYVKKYVVNLNIK